VAGGWDGMVRWYVVVVSYRGLSLRRSHPFASDEMEKKEKKRIQRMDSSISLGSSVGIGSFGMSQHHAGTNETQFIEAVTY
jgi:hypothetical protein